MPLLLEIRDAGMQPNEKRYEWLVRAIESLSVEADVPDRAMIPTEKQLVAAFGLSRQTVRRAMDRLVNDGRITRVAGRGTFLTPQPDDIAEDFVTSKDLLASPLNAWYEITTPLHKRVDVSAAGRLRLSSDQVSRIAFRRSDDERPYGYTNVSMPPDIGDLLADVESLTSLHGGPGMTTVSAFLDARLDGGITSAERSITASAFPAEAAEILGRQEGDIGLQLDTVFFDRNARAVALQSSFYLPHTYSDRATFVRTRRS